MEQEQTGKKGKYITAAAIILVTAVCIIWIFWQQTAHTGKYVEVRVSGEVIRTVSMDRADSFEIQGKNNINLKVLVQTDGVRVEYSDCPDKICVNTGLISKTGQTIVCLPAETVLEVKDSSRDNAVDA